MPLRKYIIFYVKQVDLIQNRMELKYKTKDCGYSSTGKSIGCSCRNQASIPSSSMTAHICLELPSVFHKYCTCVVHRHIRKQDTHTHQMKEKNTKISCLKSVIGNSIELLVISTTRKQ